MPKASKSSASSGTRKKHAKKAAGPSSDVSSTTTKLKPSKKEIKKGLAPAPKKSYIAPSKLKPPPLQIDPLDSHGLAAILPAELVVVLRRLAKKDSVTKTRALEELSAWVRNAADGDIEVKSQRSDVSKDVLVTVLPVWLHRYPSLSVHPSRRIRTLSASLHASLLRISTLRNAMLMFLLETGSETQVSQLMGAWCLSVWDVDRGVATLGNKSWAEVIDVKPGDSTSTFKSEDKRFVLDDKALVQSVLPLIVTAIMDPTSAYATLTQTHSTTSGGATSPSRTGTPRQSTSLSKTVIARVSGGNGALDSDVLSVASSRGEDDPESSEDRNARLRVGAMGVLKWIFDTYPPTATLVSALHWPASSPQFWSVLHHAAQPSFWLADSPLQESEDTIVSPSVASTMVEGFGAGQTMVRRAGWSIVHALVGGSGTTTIGLKWIDHLFDTNSLRLLLSAILRSAFVEPDPVVRSSMWGPLLLSLTKVDNAWMLSYGFEHSNLSRTIEPHDESESSASGYESETDANGPKPDPTPVVHSNSTPYSEFLNFLALGCNGSPIQGYPTVLVILSTIPNEILPSTLSAVSGFFDALWAAIDGQALSTLATLRTKGMDAFLGTWGECLLWTTGKLMKTIDATSLNHPRRPNVIQDSSIAVARTLVEEQFSKLVSELGKGLPVDTSIVGGKVATVLGKLEVVAPDLFEHAWMQVYRYATTTIANEADTVTAKYAIRLLAVLHQELSPECLSKQKVERLVIAIASEVVSKCIVQPWIQRETVKLDDSLAEALVMNGKLLETLLNQFGKVMDSDQDFVKHIDELFRTSLKFLLSQPSLILSYLIQRSEYKCTVSTWHLLISTIGSSVEVDLDTRLRVLSVLLDSAESFSSLKWAKPHGGELDELAEYVLSRALDGDESMLTLAERFLKRSDAFLDTAVTETLICTIIRTVGTLAQCLVRDTSTPLKKLRSSLDLLLALERRLSQMSRTSMALMGVIPSIFLLAFVLPQCSPVPEEVSVLDLSKRVWESWRENADAIVRENVFDAVKDAIKGLIINTDIRPRPVTLVRALQHANFQIESRLLSEILQKPYELDDLLSHASTDPIDSTLSIIEPLARTFSSDKTSRRSWNHNFDGSGFSPYARSVSCLLYVMTYDRRLARDNMWALRHALNLALFASEVLQVPGAESPVFGSNPKAAVSDLREISQQAQQLTAFLLIPPGEDLWHKELVGALASRTSEPGTLDPMGAFVQFIFEASLVHETVRESLVLHTVLQHTLRNATKDDADLWIELARSIEAKALQTSLAVTLAVTEFAPEPPKLDRYRNELASKISGMPPTKANTIGLRLLRRLSAVAPNPESDVIFLPQQRAVYLAQAFQAWMTSDEDLDEGVEIEITFILFHLAPILQDVRGTHWEFFIDMMESNIENSSLNDADTLVLLSGTLRLLTTIQMLSVSNRYLKELWADRSKPVLAMVRDLLAVKIDRTSSSIPRTVCQEQALSVIQDLPASLIDETTLATMCHLVTDSSVDVQLMAHKLLQQAAITRTEHLVIEAGVESQGILIGLPLELIALLQSSISFEVNDVGSNAGERDPLAYLLGWMILFDLFADASLTVKTAYVDQLRTLNMIGGYFLPNIFDILGIGGEGQKPFKLDVWDVEEYWTPLYDVDTPQSLRLLAAHLYYRALLNVPSLIRTWWDELKDRQLLAAVTAFTSSHFSPVLIASELAHLKPSSATAPVPSAESLTDESFNVKVALAVHEVIATFNVDDQQMEIGVRLPAEYPLRPVEVRDIRRVGVPEKLWRKWLFAVQQVVTSQNGRIVDALSLFKKNVSLHFEGQVECAICYSIISVVDRSLPSKPCKTCKNRFHSSCLYKWFNTSHSSSCPLCRSDIM